ncbi:hypothetical protein ACFO8Q_05340 [Effusibacillus consociatus]|uniref:Uncharacterized protein n=1 Tax=Effusibacillus consociatus TaxID=1117041 RepID=A0ABV9Q0E0_9BACL
MPGKSREGDKLISLSISLVIGSGVLHAIWNLFTKQSRNKIGFLWWTQWVGIVIYIPFVFAVDQSWTLSLVGSLLLVASILFHGVMGCKSNWRTILLGGILAPGGYFHQY